MLASPIFGLPTPLTVQNVASCLTGSVRDPRHRRILAFLCEFLDSVAANASLRVFVDGEEAPSAAGMAAKGAVCITGGG